MIESTHTEHDDAEDFRRVFVDPLSMRRHSLSVRRFLSWLAYASMAMVALSCPAAAQRPRLSAFPPIRIVDVTGVEREAMVTLLEPMLHALAPCGVEEYAFVIQFDGRLTDVRFEPDVAPRWARCARQALETLRYPAGPGTSSLTSRPETLHDLLQPPAPAPPPTAPAIELTTDARVVDGPLAADEATAVVARAAPALRASLRDRTRTDELPATIELELRVSADGAVQSASVTAGAARLGSFALGVARRWRFPAHPSASTVRVTLVISPRS